MFIIILSPCLLFQIGVPVIVLSTKGDSPEKGYIRYVGETEFALGAWVGVQLDNMKGKAVLID